MKRVRQRVKELAPNRQCHADIRKIIAQLNPVLRGWGNYFRTGNAANQFIQIDRYVCGRLRTSYVRNNDGERSRTASSGRPSTRRSSAST
jgi:RNA-directed DNA polymerase